MKKNKGIREIDNKNTCLSCLFRCFKRGKAYLHDIVDFQTDLCHKSIAIFNETNKHLLGINKITYLKKNFEKKICFKREKRQLL